MQLWLKELFQNRKKYAHILAVFAAAVALEWSTNPKFKAQVEHEASLLPAWIQGLAGFATFVVPLYITTKKLLNDGGAQ